MCYCTVFTLSYFGYEYKPLGAYIWGAIYRTVFCVTSLGGLVWRCLFMDGLIFRTFMVSAFITVTIKELLETG